MTGEIIIRNDEAGDLDEVIWDECAAHLERMDVDSWSLMLRHRDGRIVLVRLYTGPRGGMADGEEKGPTIHAFAEVDSL